MPETQLMEDLKEGHQLRFAKMWQENRNLKECLSLFQGQISKISKKIVNSILFYNSHSKIAASLSAEYKIDLAKLKKLSVQALQTSHYDELKTKKLCGIFKESLSRFESFINQFMNPLQMLHFTERLMAKFPEISDRVKDFKNVQSLLDCMSEWLASQQSLVSAKSGIKVHQTKAQVLASQKPFMPSQISKRSSKCQNQNQMEGKFDSEKKFQKSAKYLSKIMPFHMNTKSMDTNDSPEKPQRKIWKKGGPNGISTFLGSKIKN